MTYKICRKLMHITYTFALSYDLLSFAFVQLLLKDETAFRELDLDNLISKLVLPKVRINNTGSLNASTYSTGEKGISIIVCEGFFCN